MARKLSDPHAPGAWNHWLPSVSGAPSSALHRALLDWEGRRFLAGAAGAGTLDLARPPVRVYAGVRHAPSPEERAGLAVAELVRLGGLDRRLLVVCSPTGTGYVDTAALVSAELLADGDCASVAVQFGTARSQSSLASLAEAARSMAALLGELAQHGRRARSVVWAESFGSWALLEALAGDGDDQLLAPAGDAVALVGVPGPALADARLRPLVERLAAGAEVARDGDELATRPASGRDVVLVHDDDPVAHVPGMSLAWRPQRHRLPTAADAPRGRPGHRYRRRWLPVLTALRARSEVDAATRPGGPDGMRRPHDYRYAAFDAMRVVSGIEATDRHRAREQVARCEQHMHDALLWLGPAPTLADPWRLETAPSARMSTDTTTDIPPSARSGPGVD